MLEPIPIIRTKLQPPLLRRSLFPRPRLAGLLRQAVERRLTLVCAAPGSGKTTLIASALAQAGAPVAWYTLSRSDRDLATFCSYLAEAFEQALAAPGLAEAVRRQAGLGTGAQPQPSAYVAACVNHLSSLVAAGLLVVLDDFQLVDQSLPICQVLDQLVAYAPAGVHFVLATRATPRLSGLARLRAEGQVLEIGEGELRFGLDEAGQLFGDYHQLSLSEARLAQLVEQTEGWTMGLLLAGQTLKSGAETQSARSWAGALADQQVLFDYLTEEILRQQPPAMVDFLTSSAILSRLQPAVCDAALGRTDSAQRLRDLERRCLFVIPTEDGWLRYHRLFRQFLLQQLAADPERLETLHRRAAAYFEDKQNNETAIYHWLEARAYRPAAQLIAVEAGQALHAGRLDTLSYWLSQLPEAEFEELPVLWLRHGQMFETVGQWDRALECFGRAAQAYRARGDLLGLSAALQHKGQILDWCRGRFSEAEQLLREALSYVGEEHKRERAALLANLARTQLSAGNTSAARSLYREALATYEAEADRQGQLDTLLNPGAWLHHNAGEFTAALSILRRAEQLALDLGSPRCLAETCNNFAANLYRLGRYAESLDYARRALRLSREQSHAHGEAFALMNQANALEATCGASYTDLFAQFRRALHLEQALHNQRFVIAVLVSMSVLARRGGDAAEAAQRAQQALALAEERGLRWLASLASVQLGAAQIWLDARAARAALDQALRIAAECGDGYHLMLAHFWLASLGQAQADGEHVEHLRECLCLAVAHHYDSFFASEAQASIPLLVCALQHDLWPAYVAPILVGFGQRAAESLRPLLRHADPQVCRRARAALKEIGVKEPSASPAPGVRPIGPAVTPLSIECFGPFTVWRGAHRIEEREWGRKKCKRLLKYLALSPGQTLSKDALVDLLWGGAEPEAASANFHRTLYHLRRVLEPLSPHSGANTIALEGGLVRLAPEAIDHIDLVDFEREVEAGRRLDRAGDSAGALEHLAGAAALYRDDLACDDLYDEWVQPRREQLRETYLEVLRDLARLAAHSGQTDLAIQYLAQAFHKDRTSEAVCLKLMQKLAQAGLRSEALQHYAICERALAELGLRPSDDLRAAHTGLLAVPLSLPLS